MTTNAMYYHFRSTGRDDKGGLIAKLHELRDCGLITYRRPNKREKIYTLTDFGVGVTELYHLSRDFFDSMNILKSLNFDEKLRASPYQLKAEGWTRDEIADRISIAIRSIKFRANAWQCYIAAFMARYGTILLKFDPNKKANRLLEELSKDLLFTHISIGESMFGKKEVISAVSSESVKFLYYNNKRVSYTISRWVNDHVNKVLSALQDLLEPALLDVPEHGYSYLQYSPEHTIKEIGKIMQLENKLSSLKIRKSK